MGDGLRDGPIEGRRDEDIATGRVEAIVNHGEGEEVLAPELLQGRCAEVRVVGVDEEGRETGELVIARPQARRLLVHRLGVFDLGGDEAVLAGRGGDLEQGVEGRAVLGEGGVAAGRGMLEEGVFDLVDEARAEAAQDGGGETRVQRQRADEIERRRHGRQEIAVEAVGVDEGIVLAPGDDTAGKPGDVGGNEVGIAMLFGEVGAEFALFVAAGGPQAHRPAFCLTEECLPGAGSGAEAVVGLFVDVVGAERCFRNERHAAECGGGHER